MRRFWLMSASIVLLAATGLVMAERSSEPYPDDEWHTFIYYDDAGQVVGWRMIGCNGRGDSMHGVRTDNVRHSKGWCR